MRTNDDRACPQWSQTFNCRLRKDRHISWKNEDVYTRVGERKETVEYWLFTCKQNTSVFNYGDLGRGGGLSFRVLFFQSNGKGDPILVGTTKVPRIEGGGLCTTQKRGDLICERKGKSAPRGLEVGGSLLTTFLTETAVGILLPARW